MSTFDGKIKEIPFISIDYFKDCRDVKIYFLSHFHTDHMIGLLDGDYRVTSDFFYMLKTSKAFLYASPITIRFLKSNLPDGEYNLRALEVGKTTIVKYEDDGNEKFLQVTAVPAGHCPGSVMFFFEDELNVLYTGDFRINPDELHKYEIFRTATGKMKVIDIVYLDSTFFKDIYEHFPTRKRTIKALCDVVREYIKTNEVCLETPAWYGPEYLLLELYNELKEKIHVNKQLHQQLYKYVPEFDNVFGTDEGSYKIHLHSARKQCCWVNCQRTKTIRITAKIWMNYRSENEPIQVNENKTLVCSSFHPSCSEVKEFLKYLRPKKVQLNVVPDDDVERDKMYKLLDTVMSEYNHKEEEKSLIIERIDKTRRLCDRQEKSEASNFIGSPERTFKRRRFYNL